MNIHMKVKELREILSDFDDDTPVARIYGQLMISTPSIQKQHRYITHPLIAVVEDDSRNRCLLLFEDL